LQKKGMLLRFGVGVSRGLVRSPVKGLSRRSFSVGQRKWLKPGCAPDITKDYVKLSVENSELPNVWNALLTQAKDPMDFPLPHDGTKFDEVLGYLWDIERSEDAIKWFADMESNPEVRITHKSLEFMINGLLDLEQKLRKESQEEKADQYVARAFELFGKMRNDIMIRKVPHIYVKFLGYLEHPSNLSKDGVLEIWNELEESQKFLGDFDELTLTSFFPALTDKGHVKEAFAVYEKLKTLVIQYLANDHFTTLNQKMAFLANISVYSNKLAIGLLEADHFDQGAKIIADLESSYDQLVDVDFKTQECYIVASAKTGNLDVAEKIFSQTNPFFFTVDVYNCLISAFLDRNDLEKAGEYLSLLESRGPGKNSQTEQLIEQLTSFQAVQSTSITQPDEESPVVFVSVETTEIDDTISREDPDTPVFALEETTQIDEETNSNQESEKVSLPVEES
jgi:pentatricopeptide repeat protein